MSNFYFQLSISNFYVHFFDSHDWQNVTTTLSASCQQQQNGLTLVYASEETKNNEQIVAAAIEGPHMEYLGREVLSREMKQNERMRKISCIEQIMRHCMPIHTYRNC